MGTPKLKLGRHAMRGVLLCLYEEQMKVDSGFQLEYGFGWEGRFEDIVSYAKKNPDFNDTILAVAKNASAYPRAGALDPDGVFGDESWKFYDWLREDDEEADPPADEPQV